MNARMHHNRLHNDRMTRYRRERRTKFIGFGAFFLLVVAGAVVVGIFYLSSQQTVTCTVESKERTTKVSDGNSTQQKLVYTEQCGVLEVQDNLLLGKFNSADTYGSLDEGKTYEIDQIGFRNGFLSMFPNVLEAREVKA